MNQTVRFIQKQQGTMENETSSPLTPSRGTQTLTQTQKLMASPRAPAPNASQWLMANGQWLFLSQRVNKSTRKPPNPLKGERKCPFMIRDPTSEDRLAIVVSPANYGKIGKKNK